ncbi:hypothetical protein BD309DRAFT_696599 [Dichomitus squalens]|nr:hypothetical protein BD309DRAFT_696599 [Dichomitus squalens]
MCYTRPAMTSSVDTHVLHSRFMTALPSPCFASPPAKGKGELHQHRPSLKTCVSSDGVYPPFHRVKWTLVILYRSVVFSALIAMSCHVSWFCTRSRRSLHPLIFCYQFPSFALLSIVASSFSALYSTPSRSRSHGDMVMICLGTEAFVVCPVPRCSLPSRFSRSLCRLHAGAHPPMFIFTTLSLDCGCFRPSSRSSSLTSSPFSPLRAPMSPLESLSLSPTRTM